MRILGIDPGLNHTGWGVIEIVGNKLTHVADGVINSDAKETLAQRLDVIYQGLIEVVKIYQPENAAVEETFVNKNPVSTLKLGQARGVALLAPAHAGLSVFEYPANLIKKSVVGSGHADKNQIQMMVKMLLNASAKSADSADALAVAICHAHHYQTKLKIGGIMSGGVR